VNHSADDGPRREAVRVRMYRVGFGDCFLIRIPSEDTERLILVDCGVHTASKGGVPLDEVVERVIADVTDLVGEPRIDVVVATHRHRDHVEGFDNPAWMNVNVDEVWLPWTENPKDPLARRLLSRQSRRAMHLAELSADHNTERWLAIRALANNSLKNAAAMAMLHHGFAGAATRRYLPSSSCGRSASFTTSALPGVTVHVLGPSRDEAIIRDIEPPAGGTYLRTGRGGNALTIQGPNLPFDRFIVPKDDYRERFAHLMLRSEGTVVAASRTDPLAAAAALEQAVNGTSLMLAFEYRGITLVFAGDAQWGTWNAALDDAKRNGILTRADFYKVGHHGSHNATPREFVESCLHGAQFALVPVARTNIPAFSEIPRLLLLEALADPQRCEHVIRSDAPPETAPESVTVSDVWIEVEVVGRPDGGTL
jgi:beta-lactamase superfamily II metal-dependent hydrolase